MQYKVSELCVQAALLASCPLTCRVIALSRTVWHFAVGTHKRDLIGHQYRAVLTVKSTVFEGYHRIACVASTRMSQGEILPSIGYKDLKIKHLRSLNF